MRALKEILNCSFEPAKYNIEEPHGEVLEDHPPFDPDGEMIPEDELPQVDVDKCECNWTRAINEEQVEELEEEPEMKTQGNKRERREYGSAGCEKRAKLGYTKWGYFVRLPAANEN
ncbi:hypothetical protein ACTXT7_016518 [Hymenolepis weldensis]